MRIDLARIDLVRVDFERVDLERWPRLFVHHTSQKLVLQSLHSGMP